jgi:nucleoid-associated protein YgaU
MPDPENAVVSHSNTDRRRAMRHRPDAAGRPAWPAALAAILLLCSATAGARSTEGGAAPADDAAQAGIGSAASASDPVGTRAALRAENTRLRARITALEEILAQQQERRQSLAREHTAQLNAAELRAREHKERLLDAQARIQALEAALAEREAHIGALTAGAERQAELRERVDALRARLPATEGGSLTPEAARRRAEQDAAALAERVEHARGLDNPHLWREVRDAENALHHSQFVLARADNARTVYRVRPGDSLAAVSRMFYGTAERWTELYDANRHVIADPQALLPGITLVVP